MGFFALFDAWLNGILATYIANNTAAIALALRPALVTCGVLYVMIWGYLQMTGRIEEPFVTGVKRILTLALIFAVALSQWLYPEVITNTFFTAPSQLAAAVIGAYDPVTIVDRILLDGNEIGEELLEEAGVLDGDIAYYFAAIAVYLSVGLTAIYTMFLLALSRIALAVLLALGPLFIGLLLFETTKRFFESWVAQLANYALITVLTVLAAALMLTLLEAASDPAAARGGDIEIAEVVRLCFTAVLALLVMRQVMSIAAGLASGVALTTHGAMSALLMWGLGQATSRRDRSRKPSTTPINNPQDVAGRRLVSRVKQFVRRPNTVRPA